MYLALIWQTSRTYLLTADPPAIRDNQEEA